MQNVTRTEKLTSVLSYIFRSEMKFRYKMEFLDLLREKLSFCLTLTLRSIQVILLYEMGCIRLQGCRKNI